MCMCVFEGKLLETPFNQTHLEKSAERVLQAADEEQ